MANEQIAFDLTVTGERSASQAFNNASRSLRSVDASARRTSQSLPVVGQQFRTVAVSARASRVAMQQTTARAAGLASVMGALGTQTRALSPAFAGVTGAVGSSGEALAGLTAIIGPRVALIGTTLVAALGILGAVLDETEDKFDKVDSTVDRTSKSLSDFEAQVSRTAAEAAKLSRIELGVGSIQEQRAAVELAEQNLQEATKRAQTERAAFRRAVREDDLERLAIARDFLPVFKQERIEAERILEQRKEALRVAIKEREASLRQPLLEPDRGGRGGGGRERPSRDINAEALAFNRDTLARDLMGGPAPSDEEFTEDLVKDQQKDRRKLVDSAEQMGDEIFSVEKQNAERRKQVENELTAHKIQQQERVAQAGKNAAAIGVEAAITATSAVIQGNEKAAEAILAGIGDQLVASGVRDLLEAAGLGVISFGTDPRAAALLGIGALKITTGTAMGAAFSSTSGAGGASSGPTTSGARQQPARPERDREPRDDLPAANIVVNLRSVAGVTDDDGRRVAAALEKHQRKRPQTRRSA